VSIYADNVSSLEMSPQSDCSDVSLLLPCELAINGMSMMYT
jgi:hypothetical protein